MGPSYQLFSFHGISKSFSARYKQSTFQASLSSPHNQLPWDYEGTLLWSDSDDYAMTFFFWSHSGPIFNFLIVIIYHVCCSIFLFILSIFQHLFLSLLCFQSLLFRSLFMNKAFSYFPQLIFSLLHSPTIIATLSKVSVTSVSSYLN